MITRRTFLALSAAAGADAVLTAETRERGAGGWVDAFQSSPAAFTLSLPECATPCGAQALLDAFRPGPTVTGTLRMRLAPDAAGRRLRIRLSNEEGAAPLVVAAASIARAVAGTEAAAETMRPLTFGGQRTIRIAPGAPAVSDPVDLVVARGDALVVSIDASGFGLTPSGIQRGAASMALAPAGQALAPRLEAARTVSGRPFVSGLSVLTPDATRVVVALGDSITDANGAGVAHGWTDVLRARIGAREPVAVVNAGIAGNRLLANGWGTGVLARLERDALRVAGATHLILFAGINDIGMAGPSPLFRPEPPLDTADLLAGYQQVVERSHTRGLKVVGATIAPFGGSAFFSTEKEQQRRAANDWIRTAGLWDGTVDMDAVLRTPADPTTLRAVYDSGDHLHPNAAGHAAMGAAIDLALLR